MGELETAAAAAAAATTKNNNNTTKSRRRRRKQFRKDWKVPELWLTDFTTNCHCRQENRKRERKI
jgi:hypothetical protein